MNKRNLPGLSTTGKDNNASNFDKIAQIRDYLNEHYEIKINCFDHTKSIIKSKTKEYRFPPTVDDISLDLTSAGITHSDTILRKIISSPNQIATYNPINDYFENIKNTYQGVSHIDKLSSYITARDFEDKKKGFYQERMVRLLKKWMVATVACALNEWPNEVALGFIQKEEGIGKTFFFHFIVPDPLKEFYTKSSKDPKKFDLQEAFAKNFIINFDEFEGITNRNSAEFKKVMSDFEIMVKLPRDPYPVNMPRIGAAVFTTNRSAELGGFLTPNLGYRRFACIEIDNIDHDYSKEVDVDQMWAEAYMLYKSGTYNYKFNDDYQEFQEYNQRYQIETPAIKLVRMYLSKPTNGKDSEFMQPTQIMQWMANEKKVRSELISKVTPESLGMALAQLDFVKKSSRTESGPRWGYYVSLL
jgi:predicted P-loop ATPase